MTGKYLIIFYISIYTAFCSDHYVITYSYMTDNTYLSSKCYSVTYFC